MLVDVRVILSGPMAIIIALTLSIVALFGKWLAAYFTQKVFKYSRTQRQIIFGLSSSHAAATLAVILVGYQAKILDENILNGTIILILITCIVASFATEKAAKKSVVETESGMDDFKEANKKDEQILLPIANTANMDKALEFAVLIKDKKSRNPLSILTVVPNNDAAEKNISKAKTKLENYIKTAAASETNAEVVATIDHNASSGIARTARELMADIVLLGWPQRKGFIEKLIGERIESILQLTEKTLFICDFERPLINHKQLFVVVPPLAELENGFRLWVSKVSRFSQELSLPIVYHCNEETQKAIVKCTKQLRINTVNQFCLFEDWEDFFILSKNLQQDDFFIIILARKGAISHLNVMENLPTKSEKYFPTHSKIVIYP